MNTQLIALIPFCLLLSACHQPKKDPHTFDPIFLSYQTEIEAVGKQIETQNSEVAKSEASLTSLEEGSNDRLSILEAVFEKQQKISKLHERKRYLLIKIAERKLNDQKTYRAAFENGKAWPDDLEVKNFEIEKAMEIKRGQEWSPLVRIKELLPDEKAKPAGAEVEEKESHE